MKGLALLLLALVAGAALIGAARPGERRHRRRGWWRRPPRANASRRTQDCRLPASCLDQLLTDGFDAQAQERRSPAAPTWLPALAPTLPAADPHRRHLSQGASAQATAIAEAVAKGDTNAAAQAIASAIASGNADAVTAATAIAGGRSALCPRGLCPRGPAACKRSLVAGSTDCATGPTVAWLRLALGSHATLHVPQPSCSPALPRNPAAPPPSLYSRLRQQPGHRSSRGAGHQPGRQRQCECQGQAPSAKPPAKPWTPPFQACCAFFHASVRSPQSEPATPPPLQAVASAISKVTGQTLDPSRPPLLLILELFCSVPATPPLPQAVASAISEATGQTVDPGALTSGNSQAVSNAINSGTGGELLLLTCFGLALVGCLGQPFT